MFNGYGRKNMSFDDVVSKSETWSGETISNQRLGQVIQYQIRDLVRRDNIKSETWSGETISNQRLGQVKRYQIRDLVR